MASSKDYLDFVLEQISGLDDITYKAMMDNQYKIKSNRESDDGRYDISMFPRDAKYPGIIMELKSDSIKHSPKSTNKTPPSLARTRKNILQSI